MVEPNQRQVISKMSLTKQINSSESSLLKNYQLKIVGNDRLTFLIQYELITLLFANVTGGLGYFLRKRFYPFLFKGVGSGVIFGKDIVLRNPQNITIKDHVAIDDYVLLDASGAGEKGIIIENNVIISRNCVIQGKTAPIVLGKNVNIGCNVMISSVSGIFIGNSVLIAGNCYIGGGRYISDQLDIPMMEQGIYSKGPVVIEDDVWLGSGSIILDGVRIGKGCIVGAGAVVTKDLPNYAVATGVPAQILRMRQEISKSIY